VRRFLSVWMLGIFFLLPSVSRATTATIIGDSSSGNCRTSQAQINTNLTNILSGGLGYTVTYVDLATASFPSLTGETQVWDIRCYTALSGSDQTDYQTYLGSGGSLFLLGENDLAAARNSSIASFVTSLGGGTVTTSGLGTDLQTVLAPFTGPISISSVLYVAVGNFTSYGTGSPVSQAGSSVGTVYWGPGTLSNVMTGTVISMLDVNPLITSTLRTNFVSNIASYLASPNPTPPTPPAPPQPIPMLTEWGQIMMMLAMIATAGFYGWRMKQR